MIHDSQNADAGDRPLELQVAVPRSDDSSFLSLSNNVRYGKAMILMSRRACMWKAYVRMIRNTAVLTFTADTSSMIDEVAGLPHRERVSSRRNRQRR